VKFSAACYGAARNGVIALTRVMAVEQAGYVTGHILGIDGCFVAARVMYKNWIVKKG